MHNLQPSLLSLHVYDYHTHRAQFYIMGDYAYGADQQPRFWISGAQITKGRIFRAIRKNGKPWGTGLDLGATRPWSGMKTLPPTDARRSCPRIYYDAKAPLEQIKYMLGHDKLDTMAKYVNDEHKFGEGAVTKVVDIS